MKERIKLFLSYGAYWMIFFFVSRVLFLLYYYNLTTELTSQDIFLSILNGARLDLSATGYFLLLPGLVICITSFFRSSFTEYFLNIYTALITYICGFVVILDLEMYQHWSFRLDATPLLYIGQDTTIAISGTALAILIISWLLLSTIFYLGYSRFIRLQAKDLNASDWKTSLVMLLFTAAMIAPIRGTTDVAPINTGTVYFHPTNTYANHSAINVVWNTGYALSKLNKLRYPENFYDKDKTTAFFQELHSKPVNTEKLLKTDRPNVILIIIESFTYRFIEPLGGIPGIAPNFSRLAKEGVLFDHIYASGDRTDKGIVAVLSGYPSQPSGSIIKYPKKTSSLPYLSKKFEEAGYTTGFTYGGNIDFANFRSYLSTARFNQITHSGSFPDELNNSKWGVHDGYVFERFGQEADTISRPFFKTMLTLSSHEPFTVPMETYIEGDDDISKFENSAHYTDKSLGEFIDHAKKSDWWDNTLIVITADHGHPMPDNQGLTNPRRFKIPLLWLGGALNKTDTVVHTYGSQTDIATTILNQVQLPHEDFIFSKDLLNKNDEGFAVFIFNSGYGYVAPEHTFVYDNVSKNYVIEEGEKTEDDYMPGKAFMQMLYTDYNKR